MTSNISHESTYYYQVIKRAIALIDMADMPLSLEVLAADMNMSPGHFQRVFSKWVGVSPKAYQQYLMIEHAKELLRSRKTTLETAGALGLSGTGRLYDMFIKWEAMSPGEFAQKGAGLLLNYGWFDTPFGEALAVGNARGLCGLGFADDLGRDWCFEDMHARWPKAELYHAPKTLRTWVENSFSGSGETRVHLIGAPFQVAVWRALMSIPSGYVTSYSDIAGCIGKPKAVRAVGTAVGRNPISWVIPCHRALRKSGGLGGYHWGLPRKRAMLAYEAAIRDSIETPTGEKSPPKAM